ncbi:MAG: pantoate--beta-alanine ligase [Planctomycetes bacterium]|nr:pantoate--beta-alanine ligase [Planctomycetota bacterium]
MSSDPSFVRRWSRAYRAAHLRLGFVPTMGALHDGHLSLVRAARRECDRVLVSIFVNPLQFGPGEDYSRYPRPFERDADRCLGEGADGIFRGADGSLYPPGFATHVEVERLTAGLCGASRPGHFRGVATVVTKLLAIVEPHAAYFGAKDYQQSVVIRRLAADLDLPVRIRVLPTVREPDGLAMSSRNAYLSPPERRAATCLVRALERARLAYDRGERDAGALRAEMEEVLLAEPLARPEYVEVVDPETLETIERADAGAVLALAVHIGRTRLIDNALLGARLP